MNRKSLLLGLALASFLGFASGVSGDFTGDNTTDSFSIESSDINANLSVNEFGTTIENVSSIYVDNVTQSRSFNVSVEGNVSELLDFPGTVTLFNNQSSSFPLVGNVPVDQPFGGYKGNLSLTGLDNNNFSESVNVSISVVDDISPEFTDVNIGSVMSTESVDWSVVTNDNLNTTLVKGNVVREYNNSNSTLVNESVKKFNFTREGKVEEWSYTFKDTDTIGDYYLELTAVDESGNKASRVESFQVNGLNSISVSETNFVFDTFRPKQSSGFDLVNSSIEGKEFRLSLGNLSYGGNESLRFGVIPPGGESPEVFTVGEVKTYSEAGVYEAVLIHSGNDELEGTHRVTGDLNLVKPSQHVEPRNVEISFSGTVKNLDKPPETCQRVKEFDSCIAYSLDQSRSMFDAEYGIGDTNSTDYAYLIGRIPTSDVEGSDAWGDEASLTLGEYNETSVRNVELSERVESLEGENSVLWNAVIVMPVLFVGVGGGLFVWYLKIGQYVSFAQSRRKIIEKAEVVLPDEGLN